eukprot:Colp12_sorted_trinity150504_noHs@28845
MFVSYLTLATILFTLGILGIIFNRKNIIIILLSAELMLLGINFQVLTYSVFLDDLYGIIFAIFILTLAGAESAIGLALIVSFYRYRGTIAVSFINLLHG